MKKTFIAYSKSATSEKHKYFDSLIDIYLKNIKEKEFNYIEMNAGCGIYEEYIGTPIRFLEKAIKYPIKFNIYLAEIEKDFSELLEKYTEKYKKYPNINLNIIHGDSEKTIPPLISHMKNGLIFSDPQGEFQNFKFVPDNFDLLININSSAIKRARMAYKYLNKDTLYNKLLDIKKGRNGVIKAPVGKWNWSLILLSKSLNKATLADYNSIDFFNILSDKGIKILINLSFTKKERSTYGL